MKNIIISLIAFTIVTSCVKQNNSTSENVINLNEYLNSQSINLMDKIDDVHVVTLETTNESLIGTINNIIVSDNNIIIFQKDAYCGGLLIFDKQGHFKKNIAIGEGPNELNSPYHVAFDELNNEIMVAQNTGFIKRFTTDGEFIDEIKTNNNFADFVTTANGYVFMSLASMNLQNTELADYRIYTTDKQFNILSTILPQNNLPNFGGHLIKYNNSVIVTQGLNDIIYSLDANNNLSTKLTLDYSNSHFDISDTYDIQSLLTELKAQNAFCFTGEYLETTNYQYINLINYANSTMLNIFVNKNNKQIIAGAKLETDNDILPFIQAPSITYNDYFISLVRKNDIKTKIQSSKYLSEDDISKLNNIDDENNPTLIFYKLK